MMRRPMLRLICAAGLLPFATCTGPSLVPFTPGDSTLLFRDAFDSTTLADGWTIQGGDTDVLSLTARPSFLRLFAAQPENGTEQPVRVVRPAEGDFILITRMAFQPAADRQLSGLVVEGSDGRTVSLGIIRANFPRGTFQGLSAVGERAGGGDPETAFESLSATDVYLRIERSGGQFAVSYSTDGMTYFRFANLADTLSQSVRVGVGTVLRESCEVRCDEPAPSDFDFFEIREPASDG